MAYGTVQADVIQSSVANTSLGAGNASIMKNRIINGAMVIDQRNAGASVTASATSTTTYTVDRWAYYVNQASKFTVQQTTTAPAGFNNSLKITSSSAYTVGAGDILFIKQPIEGYNMADFGWGTASAKTVTLSFWVYSSLTGTFGGSLWNNNATRCYPYTYTISAANTWQQISITIAGDTSGTWQTTTSTGVNIGFTMGIGSTYSGPAGSWTGSEYYSATGATSVVGTNGATFYITGVQLEVGSSATGFEYVNYQTSLANCQRYYYKLQSTGAGNNLGVGFNDSTTAALSVTQLPITMRTNPTALEQTGTATDYSIRFTGGNTAACSSVPTFGSASLNTVTTTFTVASGLTGGQGITIRAANATAYLAWSAEL